MAHDPVHHPSHYTSHPSGIECINVTEHFNFNRGNAIKYIWRAGHKSDEIEDLKKARFYIDREITRLKAETMAKIVEHSKTSIINEAKQILKDWNANQGPDQRAKAGQGERVETEPEQLADPLAPTTGCDSRRPCGGGVCGSRACP